MTSHDPSDAVHCPDHGLARPAFLCRHLFQQLLDKDFRPIGFCEPDSPGESVNGWCKRCDEALAREGEWNDVSEAFAGIKLVCSGCYGQARALQQGFEDLP